MIDIYNECSCQTFVQQFYFVLASYFTARVCIKGIIHIVVVLLFTEPRGQWHQYNININIHIFLKYIILYATYTACTSSYREKGIVLQRERGQELLGVVHSLIHYGAFEKTLSHSAV